MHADAIHFHEKQYPAFIGFDKQTTKFPDLQQNSLTLDKDWNFSDFSLTMETLIYVFSDILLTYWGQDKITTILWTFQRNFLEWKSSYFDSNFT